MNQPPGLHNDVLFQPKPQQQQQQSIQNLGVVAQAFDPSTEGGRDRWIIESSWAAWSS